MVTGDSWGTAKTIAREIRIENVIVEAKSEGNAKKVKEIQVCRQSLFH